MSISQSLTLVLLIYLGHDMSPQDRRWTRRVLMALIPLSLAVEVWRAMR